MSKIYLPNGATIKIFETWSQSNLGNGNLSLESNDIKKTFYGVITPAGVVHLTEQCPHQYYPPKVTSLDQAFDVVLDGLKYLPHYKLMDLKKQLSRYNGKTSSWKK